MIKTLKTLSLKLLTVIMAMVIQFDIMDSVVGDISIMCVIDEENAEQTVLIADDMGQSSVIDEAYCHNTSSHKSRVKNLYNNNYHQYIHEVCTLFSQYTQKETITIHSVFKSLWVFYCVYRI